MNRTLAVIRMQYVNKMTFIGIPLIIFAAVFATTWLIMSVIPGDGPKFTGGAQSPLWYIMGAGIQTLAYTFPFSQAMSVTRREFYLGTLASGAIAVTGITALMFVLGFVEAATGGWGVNGSYFRLSPDLWEQSPLLVAAINLVLGMCVFTAGLLFAGIYRRWGAAVLTFSLVGLGLIPILAAFIISKTTTWAAVGEAFVALGVGGVVAIAAVLAAGLSVAAYLPLRRATA